MVKVMSAMEKAAVWPCRTRARIKSIKTERKREKKGGAKNRGDVRPASACVGREVV